MGEPKTAMFAAGCFWGIEAAFRKVHGVLSTEVGYAGGRTKNPRYEDVCTGRTGHAEVVRLQYDPGVVTYGDLLATFWSIHDPTQKDRQGPDIGTNYRSIIFYHDPEQERLANQSKAELDRSGRFKRPVVTEIVPAGDFWRAEEYHQQYHEKHGSAAGCRFI
jgi:peptide-methionine (S)-S-oxide reductase